MPRKRSSPKPTPDEELPSYFLYDGRIYLGRYNRFHRTKFKAFSHIDRPLGTFAKLADAIGAVISAGGRS